MFATAALAVTIYTVKSGDTLSGIVGNRWPQVCEVNHLANCNRIYPGERLRIMPLPGGSAGRTQDGFRVLSRGSGSTPIGGPGGLYFTCAGLQALWVRNGGRAGAAFLAAEVAMAESGGYVYATGRAGEEGLWQINPVNGNATYNPDGNARAAIAISRNGTDWRAWTTYVYGLYRGRCL